MTFIQKLKNEQFAKSAARFMKWVCYFAICFCILCLVVSCIGRQSFTLHTKAGTFKGAIYAEEDHDPPSRALTVSMGDDIHVWTDADDNIDLAVPIGLSLMYVIQVIPLIVSTCFLGRVFANIQDSRIFVEENASYLLSYGLLQFFSAVFVPFVKLLICQAVNCLSDSRISIATGQTTFNLLLPSITFFVAAYIIHYGVHLQDEVDHTL